MRVVVQRVKEASCRVNGHIVSKIEQGFLLLVGFKQEDELSSIDKMVKKIAHLRVFSDQQGKMNVNISDQKGAVLSISQFTLYADTSGGNRPSFVDSMEPIKAQEYFDIFNKKLREYSINVEEGVFGEHMEISLVNDGPVTLQLEF